MPRQSPGLREVAAHPEDFIFLRIRRVILCFGLRAERSIKPFVIGRKAWLFSNTARGAKASAIIYSIVETAKENGLKPFAYLEYCLEQLPNRDLTDPASFATLLPWSDDLPRHLHLHRA